MDKEFRKTGKVDPNKKLDMHKQEVENDGKVQNFYSAHDPKIHEDKLKNQEIDQEMLL